MCCLLVFHTLCHRLARAVKRPTLCAAARLRDPALRVAHSAAVALTAMRTDTCAAALEANVGLFIMGTPQSDLALTAALSALRPLQAVGTTQSDLALSAALHTLRALFVVRAASRGLRGQHQQHFVEAMRLKFYALGDGLRPYINVVLTPPPACTKHCHCERFIQSKGVKTRAAAAAAASRLARIAYSATATWRLRLRWQRCCQGLQMMGLTWGASVFGAAAAASALAFASFPAFVRPSIFFALPSISETLARGSDRSEIRGAVSSFISTAAAVIVMSNLSDIALFKNCRLSSNEIRIALRARVAGRAANEDRMTPPARFAGRAGQRSSGIIFTETDILRCTLELLILDESCHESVAVLRNLSRVCKATAAVMHDPLFVAHVCVPWLTPYRVLLRIPQMDTNQILRAIDAHATHAGLLTTAFVALVAQFCTRGYYDALCMSDACPCDLMVPVIVKAMTAHPASPVVLHLACMVIAYYCGTKHVSCTEVVASGVLVLAVEAEYKYCADAVGPYTGFQTLLKSLHNNTEVREHVVRARAGRQPPAHARYTE